jgi:hypothetical protein
VVSFTLRPLYPQGKSPWYPLDRRLGWPQSRSGRGGEESSNVRLHNMPQGGMGKQRIYTNFGGKISWETFAWKTV